jgi:hypothetical protein
VIVLWGALSLAECRVCATSNAESHKAHQRYCYFASSNLLGGVKVCQKADSRRCLLAAAAAAAVATIADAAFVKTTAPTTDLLCLTAATSLFNLFFFNLLSYQLGTCCS